MNSGRWEKKKMEESNRLDRSEVSEMLQKKIKKCRRNKEIGA